MEYRVAFTNFGYSKHFGSEEEARAAVKKAGFEASIWRGETRVASWTVFGGWRNFSAPVKTDPVKVQLESSVESLEKTLEAAKAAGMSGVTVTYKALEGALREAQYALEAY